MAIRLVVDSTADAPKELVEKFGLKVVPLTVNFGDESYLDGVEISAKQFFEKLAMSEKLPTTSQPTPASFFDTFNEILEQGDEIITILISGKLSGTCESARMAKEMIGSDKIHIIDSGSASIGTCLLVEKAYDMINEGLSAAEVVKKIEDIKEKLTIYVGVDTLKYLEKGGRLSKGAAIIGTVLNVKPIIRVEKGIIESVDKVRGKGKMMKWLEDHAGENVDFSKGTVGIFHACNEESAIELISKFKEKQKAEKFFTTEIGSVVGTHIGPNAIAIAYIKK